MNESFLSHYDNRFRTVALSGNAQKPVFLACQERNAFLSIFCADGRTQKSLGFLVRRTARQFLYRKSADFLVPKTLRVFAYPASAAADQVVGVDDVVDDV